MPNDTDNATIARPGEAVLLLAAVGFIAAGWLTPAPFHDWLFVLLLLGVFLDMFMLFAAIRGDYPAELAAMARNHSVFFYVIFWLAYPGSLLRPDVTALPVLLLWKAADGAGLWLLHEIAGIARTARPRNVAPHAR